MECSFCQKHLKSANALRQHEIRCSQNPNAIPLRGFAAAGRQPPTSCEYCGKSFRYASQAKRHTKSCARNPESARYNKPTETPSKLTLHRISVAKRRQSEHSTTCVFCGNTYKSLSGVSNHEKYYCTKNPDRIVKPKRVATPRQIAANRARWTPELRQQHSDRMKQVVIDNPGSYSASNVSGRVKTYTYNGMSFKGKWELDIAKSLHHCGIEFTNIVTPIEYFWSEDNKTHLYFPDFYLPSYDIFIEVKGYERQRDRDKWKDIPNLVIIKQVDIDNIRLDYNNIKSILWRNS